MIAEIRLEINMVISVEAYDLSISFLEQMHFINVVGCMFFSSNLLVK